MLSIITAVLVAIGGINWGLIGFFDYNLIEHIVSAVGAGVNVLHFIYDLIGLSTLYKLL